MTSTVVALGFASFFTDVGSEMIYPLLPAFLATLGGNAVFLGLVEGIADAVSSVFKLASGYAADRLPRRRPLVLFGYGLASVVRPLAGIATLPLHVLLVRVTDRVGKGIRTSPRDAMIGAAAQNHERGRAFGFQRALDHAGAVVGPLVASLLLARGVALRQVFFAALLPGMISIACVMTVREPAADVPSPEARARANGTPLTASFKSYLAILAMFSIGSTSDAFLLLRARELGVPIALIPIVWSICHVAKATVSILGGRLADGGSPARQIVAGWLIYAATCVGLGLADRADQVWLLFIAYGAYVGLNEPAERTLVTALAPAGAQGRAFGYYNFVVGACAIPAGLLMGALWVRLGPAAALITSASFAAVAASALALWNGKAGVGATTAAPTPSLSPGD